MADVSHFFSKIAGVSHANRDGTRRQAALRHCHPWEHLRLETEPDNRFDPNAMALIAESGRQLGYLSSGLAAEVHQRSDKGYSFTVFIAEITGGGEDQYLGCNILVIQAGPGATEADVLAYLDEARETDDELAEMPRLRLMGQRPMPDRRELRPVGATACAKRVSIFVTVFGLSGLGFARSAPVMAARWTVCSARTGILPIGPPGGC